MIKNKPTKALTLVRESPIIDEAPIFLPGISAGANIHGAIELAKKLGKGKKVITVAPDNGERYLSTALYQ